MAHEPKLEIYKLKLADKDAGKKITIRELCRRKFNGYPEKDYPKLKRPLTQEGILETFYMGLINAIDLAGFNKNEKKKKGFTISSELVDVENEIRKTEIGWDFGASTMWGYLEGGKYGRKRTLKEIDDKTVGSPIETNHLVGDKFYFLLYTPLDENTSILMVQGYTETRISDVFVQFLRKYFSYQKTIKCDVEHFIPQNLKDKYLKSATFKSLAFSSGWKIKANFDDDFEERDYDLEVQIIITDKSEAKAKYTSVSAFLQGFANSIFKLNNTEEKSLNRFDKKKAKMESRGKDFPIFLDNETEIRPTILLTEEGVKVGEGLIPDFKAIDNYCKKLLDEIKEEIDPTNGIKRI
jgi:hypothetical protein